MIGDPMQGSKIYILMTKNVFPRSETVQFFVYFFQLQTGFLIGNITKLMPSFGSPLKRIGDLSMFA